MKQFSWGVATYIVCTGKSARIVNLLSRCYLTIAAARNACSQMLFPFFRRGGDPPAVRPRARGPDGADPAESRAAALPSRTLLHLQVQLDSLPNVMSCNTIHFLWQASGLLIKAKTCSAELRVVILGLSPQV